MILKEIYDINKKAKVGYTIKCPVCHKHFKKIQYSQAFCCRRCKDDYHNAMDSTHYKWRRKLINKNNEHMKDSVTKKYPLLKVGDKVRVKSKEWWDSLPKDKDGDYRPANDKLKAYYYFNSNYAKHCNEELTIQQIDNSGTNYYPSYSVVENDLTLEPWMFDVIESEEDTELTTDTFDIGDVVTCIRNGERGIVIDKSEHVLLIYMRAVGEVVLHKPKSLKIELKKTYEDYIDTSKTSKVNANNLKEIFKNELRSVSKEKKSTTPDTFDMSKIMYKSRRIK